MMRIARGAGLDQNVALAAQSGLDQPVMHRAGRKQRVHRQLALHQIAIGQQQHQLAVAHRSFGLIADAQDRGLAAPRRARTADR